MYHPTDIESTYVDVSPFDQLKVYGAKPPKIVSMLAHLKTSIYILIWVWGCQNLLPFTEI